MKNVLFAVLAVLSLAACKVENTRVDRDARDPAQNMERQADRMDNQADRLRDQAQDVRTNTNR